MSSFWDEWKPLTDRGWGEGGEEHSRSGGKPGGVGGKDLLETERKSPVVKEKGAELEMRLGVSCGAFRPH